MCHSRALRRVHGNFDVEPALHPIKLALQLLGPLDLTQRPLAEIDDRSLLAPLARLDDQAPGDQNGERGHRDDQDLREIETQKEPTTESCSSSHGSPSQTSM